MADAAVRLMAPDEGDGLKAFVVLHPRAGTDRQALCAKLDAWVRTQLPAPARPRAIEFGPIWLVDERGKACDGSIAERFSASSG